jgi:hypothetical protein
MGVGVSVGTIVGVSVGIAWLRAAVVVVGVGVLVVATVVLRETTDNTNNNRRRFLSGNWSNVFVGDESAAVYSGLCDNAAMF